MDMVCEAQLRKIIDQPLEKYMEGECKGILCLDHIDNNNDNNSRDNHQCLCKSMNYKKNPPKGTTRRVTIPKEIKRLHHSSERKRERKQTNAEVRKNQRLNAYQNDGQPAIVRYREMEKNINAEPIAIQFIRSTMRKVSEISYRDLIDSVAHAADCSQQTASRYVDKITPPVIHDNGKPINTGEVFKRVYINGEKMVVKRGEYEYIVLPFDVTAEQLNG